MFVKKGKDKHIKIFSHAESLTLIFENVETLLPFMKEGVCVWG